MGKNFTQVKTAIGSWLGLSTDRLPDAIRGDIVNTVLQQILLENELRFGEITDTFATVAGTRGYALPAKWSKPFSLWYEHPTNESVVFLDFVQKNEFDRDYPDASKQALPGVYTVWGSEIQLGKTPDQVLTINRNYYSSRHDLSDDFSASTVSFDTSDDSINDSAGGLPLFDVGQTVTVAGASDPGNNGNFTVVTSTVSKITVEENLVTEGAGATVTVKNLTNPLLDHSWQYVLFKSLEYTTHYVIERERHQEMMALARDWEHLIIGEDSRARSIPRRSISREP